MKQIILILAILLGQFTFGQEGDTDTKKRANEVGIEFLGLIDGQTLFTYERSFGKHFSGMIGETRFWVTKHVKNTQNTKNMFRNQGFGMWGWNSEM